MRGVLGEPVIVENVQGAADSLGIGRVARAPPDGHTIGLDSWSKRAEIDKWWTIIKAAGIRAE
jgi:tripartite-type tricarboxylate transporter receptor subunit TctC